MIKIKYIIQFFIILLLLNSCSSIKTNNSNVKPGLVLTFDDNYINEWKFADSILKKYNWKATFCLTKPYLLDNTAKNTLITLSKEHEIANHSYNHINLKTFLQKKPFEKYLIDEVISLDIFLKDLNIECFSYAYPYGIKNTISDLNLKKRYKIIRTTSKKIEKKAKNGNYYFNNNQIVNAIGLDKKYKHFNEKFFISALTYAKKNNKIIILYAHKPVLTANNKYEVEIKTLENICKFAKENNLVFYTLKDLGEMIKK